MRASTDAAFSSLILRLCTVTCALPPATHGRFQVASDETHRMHDESCIMIHEIATRVKRVFTRFTPLHSFFKEYVAGECARWLPDTINSSTLVRMNALPVTG